MANVQVYKDQGGAKLTIGASGELDVVSGGAITDDGTQASAIADISVTGTYATDDTPIETAVNSILAALRGVGIIASS